MNRLRRSLILLAVSVTLTLAAMVIRTLSAHGVFTDVTPGFGGVCRSLSGLAGPGDLQLDGRDRLLFIAAVDRRALASGKPSRKDGIYALPLDRSGGFAKLGGTPADFHPFGISLFRAPDGSLTLVAVNRATGHDPSIDTFDLTVANGTATLKERSTVAGGLLVEPDSVTAVGPSQFYATNASTSRSRLGHLIETLALIPRGNVVYFDGMVLRNVVENLDGATGILASPDGAHVYVATDLGRALYTFERNPFSGDLKQTAKLDLPANLGKVEQGDGDMLWLAGTPKRDRRTAFAADASQRAPSQVFSAAPKNGVPDTADAIYTNLGDEIGAADVAVSAGNRLFIGSPLDTKLLDCRLPQ